MLDDLQWSDPGTVGLLFHLGRYLAASRILVIKDGRLRSDEHQTPRSAAADLANWKEEDD